MKLQITKKSITIVILTIIMFALIPLEFVNYNEFLDILMMQAGPIPDVAGIFGVIYLIALVLNSVICLFENNDLQKITASVSMVFSFLTAASSTKMFTANNFELKSALIYWLLTAVIVVLVFFKEKKNSN